LKKPKTKNEAPTFEEFSDRLEIAKKELLKLQNESNNNTEEENDQLKKTALTLSKLSEDLASLNQDIPQHNPNNDKE
jgi:predicted nuclease with TOPRIM domain